MNYIEQIKYFWLQDKIYSLNGYETRLYFYLLETANCLRWELIFWQRDLQIMGNVGISKNTLNSCRNRLKQAELIHFESGGKGYGNKTRYQILTPNSFPNALPEVSPLIKQKQKQSNEDAIASDEEVSLYISDASGGSEENLAAVSLNKQTEQLSVETKNESNALIDRDICDKVIAHFNANCLQLKPVKVLTDNRKRAISERLREHGIDNIFIVINNAGHSKFLAGQSKTGWKADFDWIFQPTSFVKILEDKYSDSADSPTITALKAAAKVRNYDEKIF